MSPLDASFLHIEDAVTHMHIGSTGIVEGPPPGREEVLAAIAAKLALVPRYHVRRTALPAPGGRGGAPRSRRTRHVPAARPLPAAVGAVGRRGTRGGTLGAHLQDPPLGIEDSLERLGSLHAQMQGLKESKQAVAGERLTALSGFAPSMLLSLGARVGARLPQRSLNTVTTNVPGPQHPLHLAGRRMLEAFPFVPIGGSVRVGIAIFSYDGGLNYGITGDSEHAADVGVLARGIEAGLDELLATTERAPSASPPNGDRAAAPERTAR